MRHEGSAAAGSLNYTLVCDITITEPVSDGMPSVMAVWILASGSSRLHSAINNGDLSYYSRLPLTPLTHDDEGDYICEAYYSVDGARSPTAKKTYQVTICK